MRVITLDQVDSELSNLKFEKRENVSIRIALEDNKEIVYQKLCKIFEHNFGTIPKRIPGYGSTDPMFVDKRIMDLRKETDATLGVSGLLIVETITIRVEFGAVYDYLRISDYFLINPSPKKMALQYELDSKAPWKLNHAELCKKFSYDDVKKIYPTSIDLSKIYKSDSRTENIVHITKYLKHLKSRNNVKQKRKKETEVGLVSASFEMMKLLAKLNEEFGDDIKGTLDSSGTIIRYRTVRGTFSFVCRPKDNLFNIYADKGWRNGATMDQAFHFICGLIKGGMVI